MSDLISYPMQDGRETTLSQAWDGATGTVYVNTTPDFTFPSGTTTYIVANPGKSNMQVAKINAYSSANKTLTVSSITVNKGPSLAYTQQSHAVNSKIIISDNYAFWADIATAINSKADSAGDTFTGTVTVSGASTSLDASGAIGGFKVPCLTTAQRLALAAENGWICYDTDLGDFYIYESTGRQIIPSGVSIPNMTLTVAGAGQTSTDAHFIDGTVNGVTGAQNVATNAQHYKSVGLATAKTTLVDADALSLMDSADSNINKKITMANFRLNNLNTFTLGETMTALDVAVLQTDGNIYKWDGYADAGVAFSSDTISTTRSVMIDTNTIVIAYHDGGNSDVHLKAGTIAAGVITFGAEVTPDASITSGIDMALAKLDTNVGIVFYKSGTHTYDACSFTVSGNTITLGTPAQVNATATNSINYFDCCAIDTNKVLFVYADGGATADACMRVGTVAENILTLGTEVEDYAGANTVKEIKCCKVATDKAMVSIINQSDDIVVCIPTVSTTTITHNFGTAATYTGTAVHHSLYRISDDLAMCVFDETHIKAMYITNSTVTPTIRTANTIVSSVTFAAYGKPLVQLNSNVYGVSQAVNKITYFIADSTNYDCDVIGTIDYASEVASSTFDTGDFTLYGVGNFWAMDYTGKKIHLCNFDSHYILGILQESGTAAQSKKVALPNQVSTGHTSLSTGEKYYVNYDGTYTLDTTAYGVATAGYICMAGKALSTTTMLVNIPYEDL